MYKVNDKANAQDRQAEEAQRQATTVDSRYKSSELHHDEARSLKNSRPCTEPCSVVVSERLSSVLGRQNWHEAMDTEIGRTENANQAVS